MAIEDIEDFINDKLDKCDNILVLDFGSDRLYVPCDCPAGYAGEGMLEVELNGKNHLINLNNVNYVFLMEFNVKESLMRLGLPDMGFYEWLLEQDQDVKSETLLKALYKEWYNSKAHTFDEEIIDLSVLD